MKQQQDSNDDDHPRQQHLRDDGDDDDERDVNNTVTATKKTLSKLTDNEVLVTEIRNMVLRGGLLAPKQQQQQQQSSISVVEPPSNSTPNSTATTTTTPSTTTPISSNKNNYLFPSFWSLLNFSTTNSSDSNDDEQQQQQQQQTQPLAFTIAKESETYHSIMSTVNWYRDVLFIGTEYADKRGTERSLTAIEKARHRNNNNNNSHSSIGGIGIGINAYARRMNNNTPMMSNPDTAILHPLLLTSINNYLQSTIALDTLRPHAKWLVSSSNANNNGPLFPLAKESLAETILWSQSSCDSSFKYNLLWVLTDEEWREWAKTITSTYMLQPTKTQNSAPSGKKHNQ